MDPIEITLPKKAPGVSELISGWEDGGVYGATITQVTSKGDSVVLRVEQHMDEPEAEPEPPKVAKKPSMKVKYGEM